MVKVRTKFESSNHPEKGMGRAHPLLPVVPVAVLPAYQAKRRRRFISQTRRTWHFARSAKRKMPCSPRLAHKVPVMHAG